MKDSELDLGGWTDFSEHYVELITDPGRDSLYLRSIGLIDQLIHIIGDCSDKRVLDVGCANGALLCALRPREAFGCDCVKYELLADFQFHVADATERIPFDDEFFDVTVASLSLMFFANLRGAIGEMYRVTKPGGRCVIAVMHPSFYRTGSVDGDMNFVVEKDLSESCSFSVEIGRDVGPLMYYYRPYSEYINEFLRVGFQLRAVRDWHIDISHYLATQGEDRRAKMDRTGKVPLYTFMEWSR